MRRRIALIFGTRPEAIKLAPVVKELEKLNLKPVVISTGQHEEMLFQVLDLFEIKPDYHLKVMKKDDNLFDLTARLLKKIKPVFKKEKPSMVLVQGDTTSTFIGALSAFYNKLPIGYVESGLRSNHKYQPFPEELNRILTTHLADFHFVPTNIAKGNLLNEGIADSNIHIVGNTVIDSLLYIADVLKKINACKAKFNFAI